MVNLNCYLGRGWRKGLESYHQHLVKVLFKLINIGICLKALSISHHTPQHELIILFHQETTFKNFLTLTHQLQNTNHTCRNTEISTAMYYCEMVTIVTSIFFFFKTKLTNLYRLFDHLYNAFQQLLACLMLSSEGSPAGLCSSRSLRHSWMTLRRTLHSTRNAGRKDGRSISSKSSQETWSAPSSGSAAPLQDTWRDSSGR